jgi:hypothetical protein
MSEELGQCILIGRGDWPDMKQATRSCDDMFGGVCVVHIRLHVGRARIPDGKAGRHSYITSIGVLCSAGRPTINLCRGYEVS